MENINFKWSDEQKDFVLQNAFALSLPELSVVTGKSIETIRIFCKRNEIELKPTITASKSKYKTVTIKYKDSIIDSARMELGPRAIKSLIERTFYNMRPALLRGEKFVIEMD